MTLRRRTLLGTGAAGAAALTRPALSQPAIVQPGRTLRFIPEGDVAVLDPVWTTATVMARTTASGCSRRWWPGTRWTPTARCGA